MWPKSPSCIRFILSLFLALALPAFAENPVTDATNKASKEEAAASAEAIQLAKDTIALKQDIIELNRQLYQFEEDLLHPVNTQIAIFLGLAPETRFVLDSIELQLDNTLISSYLYQEKEISALKAGGIQKLYVGSLADGKHKLTASFNGQGSSSRYFRRKKAMTFVKEEKAKYIQLIVSEDKRTGDPLFKVKQW